MPNINENIDIKPNIPYRKNKANHQYFCPRCGENVVQLRKDNKPLWNSFCPYCGEILCWGEAE